MWIPIKKNYDVIVCGGGVAGVAAAVSAELGWDTIPDEYIPEDRTVIIHGKNAAEIEGGHM